MDRPEAGIGRGTFSIRISLLQAHRKSLSVFRIAPLGGLGGVAGAYNRIKYCYEVRRALTLWTNYIRQLQVEGRISVPCPHEQVMQNNSQLSELQICEPGMTLNVTKRLFSLQLRH